MSATTKDYNRPSSRFHALPGLQIWLALLAMLVFSLSDVFAKVLSSDLPVIQMVWFRYVGAVLVLLPFALRHPSALRSRAPALQIARGILMFGATAFLIAALSAMPVAKATTLVFVSPVFVTVLSVLVLKEAVGWVQIVCVLGGLVGVCMVAQPDLTNFDWATLLPFGSALCWACAMVLTRISQTRGDGFATTLVYAGVSGFVVVSVFALARFEMPHQNLWPAIFGMVLCWLGGQVAVLAAYRVGRVADVAPFAYSQIIWSLVFGLLFFNNLPNALALAGCAMVIVCGAIAARRRGPGRLP